MLRTLLAAALLTAVRATNATMTCGGTLPPLNESKVRLFVRLLASSVLQPDESTFYGTNHTILEARWWRTQAQYDEWWVQHTALELIRYPWCSTPSPFRGKACPQRRDRTALVRCSSAPGANRAATPTGPGAWFDCEPLFRRLLRASNTHVFSFGIAMDFAFDDRMASRGFTVHSFDPTSSSRSFHQNHSVHGVTFHFGGLQASRECGRVTTFGGSYGRLGGSLETLTSWMRKIHTTQRLLGVLKIDCEGCELPAFMQIARQEPQILAKVSVLLIEVHLAQHLRATVAGVQAFFEIIFEVHGFRLMYLRANAGKPMDQKVESGLVELGAPQGICCYEMALVRQRTLDGLS